MHDVRALNSGDTLTDTFVVDVNPASGRAKTQTVTITISGRTDVFGTNGNGGDFFGDFGTSDNQAIFGFNSFDILIGGSGDDLLVGGYGIDIIDLDLWRCRYRGLSYYLVATVAVWLKPRMASMWLENLPPVRINWLFSMLTDPPRPLLVYSIA